MTNKQISAYGTWLSPVTSASVTYRAVNLDEVKCHSSGSYWIEKRPEENGRCVIVRNSNGQTNDSLPAPYSARSRVHEYGGGVYCITDDGLYFVNDSDQNIYFYNGQTTPRSITHNGNYRYADLIFDISRHRLICIRQEESIDDSGDINTLVSIDTRTGDTSVLCSGYDFYSSPRLGPCGKKLAWLCWNHPNMPWDGTELWLANINTDSTLKNNQLIAGSGSVSIFQPEWSPDGTLTYVSDITGWWNIYQYKNSSCQPLTDDHQEFGLPQWVFAQSTYAFINNHEILCAPIKEGIAELSILSIKTGQIASLKTPWNSFSSLQSMNGKHWLIAASESSFTEIICIESTHRIPQHIRSTTTCSFDNAYYSYGKTIKFPTRNNDHAYAIYYAPKNRDYTAPKDELPPLIVITHGGPTAMSDSALDLRKQFWTSKGFALLDVNYSGSTGFGRNYRERLNNNWGIRDAEDCCDAALHMIKLGLADPGRLIIKGSSAGGYTVLCALTFHDLFSAGASYYGIGDLESLTKDTHKFESHYLDHLIGPYPAAKSIYQQRSPLQHTEKLNCPVIFFQGTEDKVVPKEQAEKMFSALRDKGLPVAYVAFEGEQHGFRKAETITSALETELYFYARIFNIPIKCNANVTIENIGSIK